MNIFSSVDSTYLFWGLKKTILVFRVPMLNKSVAMTNKHLWVSVGRCGFCWPMWFMLADVVSVGRCGFYWPMWFMLADVVSIGRCGFCWPMWFLLADGVSVGRCGLCWPMWFLLADVLLARVSSSILFNC